MQGGFDLSSMGVRGSGVIFSCLSTLGVNFINAKCTNFWYEHCVSAAFSNYMYVEKRRSYEKFVRKMLMKLTPVHTCKKKEVIATTAYKSLCVKA